MQYETTTIRKMAMRTKAGSRRTKIIDHKAINANAVSVTETNRNTCSTASLGLRYAMTSKQTGEPMNTATSNQNTVLRMATEAGAETRCEADEALFI